MDLIQVATRPLTVRLKSRVRLPFGYRLDLFNQPRRTGGVGPGCQRQFLDAQTDSLNVVVAESTTTMNGNRLRTAHQIADRYASFYDFVFAPKYLPSNIAAVVVRGGHYLSPPENVGALFRWVAPGGSSREPYLGFRCAADLK